MSISVFLSFVAIVTVICLIWRQIQRVIIDKLFALDSEPFVVCDGLGCYEKPTKAEVKAWRKSHGI